MEKSKAENERSESEQARGEELRKKMIESEEYGENFRAEHIGPDTRETKIRHEGGKNG